MLNLSDWERKNSASSPIPDLTVIFPSREIYFSRSLLSMMRFTADTCPKTLDQWYELCHPEDHAKISQLERALSGRENFLTLTRKLYCGDGQCRTFRLDAYIHRDKSGSPSRLTGRETPSLGAWLETAEDGDVIECTDPDGRVRVLEAIRIQGVMTLRDKGEIEDLQQENIRLRREIQRRIFAPSPSAFTPTPQETSSHLRSSLEESLTLSLNVLTGNAPLKALRRAMSEPALTVGILGLTGSGKTSLMNALLGENLIPEQSRTAANIPILCREGESRHARIYYQDGRVEDVRGDKLTRSYVKDLTHGSTAGIARFEAVIPGALIPEGLCFVDTPGFDALSGSGGAALRNILPELDVIIYVTPIRAAFKGSDYDSLRTILAVNKRIIFVLSQTDLERDDTEAGRVIISSQAKILADISRLKRDMKSFCGQDFDVIPVSSRLALEKFYDRKSPEWLASNIEGVVNYFAGHDPYSMALRLRAERMITLLDGALSDKKLTGSSRWRLQDYSNNIRNALKGQASLPETFGSCTYTGGPKPHDKGGKNL
ncbi:MAG: dynamin family protein, partial [Synergistaceae bacterium]|nr:dynamin family protein [Synergistaceae bacterium]